MQKILVLRESVKLRAIICDTIAVQIFRTQAPIATRYIFDDEVAKIIIANYFCRFDPGPTPTLFQFLQSIP